MTTEAAQLTSKQIKASRNSKMAFTEWQVADKAFYTLLAIVGFFILAAAISFFYVEHHGHYVTGMNNQVVWGMPHVFAIFLIVAASGAANIGSLGTVFNKKQYQPLGRLSLVIAMSLLLGGLAVLVLDLGHADRLIIAMTYYNFKSIFAWNILLYNGFLVIMAVYLWSMMDRSKFAKQIYKPAGYVGFVWRFILTTGSVLALFLLYALIWSLFAAHHFLWSIAAFSLFLICDLRADSFTFSGFASRHFRVLSTSLCAFLSRHSLRQFFCLSTDSLNFSAVTQYSPFLQPFA